MHQYGKSLRIKWDWKLFRRFGYTVKQAKRKRPEVILLEMAGIMAALERMDA